MSQESLGIGHQQVINNMKIMKLTHLIPSIRVLVSIGVSAALLLADASSVVSALTTEDRQLIQKNVLYFERQLCDIDSSGDESEGDRSLAGSDNVEKVFNFFTEDKGLKDFQAAGIIGNMAVESGVEPLRQQSIFNRKVKAENFPDPAGGSGWGIVQFTPGSKFIDPTKAAGKDPNDLKVQLDFIWDQLEGRGPLPEKRAGDDIKKTTKLEDAVLAFQGSADGRYYGYERPADKSGSVPERTAAAKAVMKKFGGSTANTTAASESDGGGNGCTCEGADEEASQSTTTGSTDLDQTLKSLAEKNGGKTTLAVASVNGSAKGNYEGDEQVPTRSSYKLYTAYATLRAIEDGKIGWDTKIWGGRSVEETMEKMIVVSNNDAALALRTNTKIGTPAKVTAMLQADVGLSTKTIMGTGGQSNSNSKSTANDFVKFLSLLEKRKLPEVEKDSSYSKLLSFMKKATTDGGSARAGIAAGVEGATVADKPGWAPAGEDPAANDVGIVYVDDNPYVVAILTDKPNDWAGVAAIAKGIHQAMSGTSGSGGSSTGGCGGSGITGGGDLSSTTKNYAHPSYHPAPFHERMPAYAEAVSKAKSEGEYIGGTVAGVEGIDCGGFVTRLMLDSGFEKKYNYSGKLSEGAGNTINQEKWLKENWQKINPKSTKDLKPGDVAINTQHTYAFVGKIDGFNSQLASASYSQRGSGRAPMAAAETAADPSFNWYRKK